ncbi:aldehyde dehydrogenase [Streptomyces clavuligerus]|nr:aldehyde dehydrogenase [Streptomyces clavuligerus]
MVADAPRGTRPAAGRGGGDRAAAHRAVHGAGARRDRGDHRHRARDAGTGGGGPVPAVRQRGPGTGRAAVAAAAQPGGADGPGPDHGGAGGAPPGGRGHLRHLVQQPLGQRGGKGRARARDGQHGGGQARAAGPALRLPVAPALAMGNTVVVKPAPQDPLSVYRMAGALAEAGIPPGVVNVVGGTSTAVGEAAVGAPAVDMVSFTGSTAVGRRIAEVCGRGMKRRLMELGGKGAALVFDDADPEAAVRAIGTTFTFYSGQICTAPTRVIAQRGIHDRLVAGLAALAARLPVGHPAEPGTVVGPVISAAHRDRVESYVALGRAEGARLVAGGERPSFERGFWVAPTLFTECAAGMRIVREEIFGPVVVVVPFDTEDEGVALVNDSEYGLMDYVWSGDTARAFRVAARLRSGGVGINTVGRHMEAPFGGFRASGVGRDVGSYALHAYSETQAIVWPG